MKNKDLLAHQINFKHTFVFSVESSWDAYHSKHLFGDKLHTFMRFSFVAVTLINMDGFSLHLKQLLMKNQKHYFKKIILKTHLHHSHITY